MSSSVLRQRLRELLEARLRTGDENYGLTPLGQETCNHLTGLHAWAERWATELETPAPTD
ncbi:hypothetical protein [Streptomyces sp. NPDC058695]|uniref:hypothetical protein n=1 Tax=Streptomyces sp. NPDC058695 TaxID=3346604 RepID=UPI00366204B6